MSRPQPVELQDMSPLEDVDDGSGAVVEAMKSVSEHAAMASVKRPEDIHVRTPGKGPTGGGVSQPTSPASTASAQKNTPLAPKNTRQEPSREGPVAEAVSPRSPQPVSADEQNRMRVQREAALRSIRGEFDFLSVPDWVVLHPLLGSYLSEGIGTFAFVLTIALVEVNNVQMHGQKDTNMTCLPIGMILMCMVFTFGYISGGHFNPAVTIAVALARKIDFKRAVGYIIAQTGAAFGAGIVAMIIQGNNDIIVPHVSSGSSYVSSGIFVELIYTFALATVILNVAYSVQKGNFFYGFAIGMTVCAGSAGAGNISGGSFNPALATGLQLAVCMTGKCTYITDFWLYWVAPVFGACLAALLFSQMAQPQEANALHEDDVA